MSKKLTSKIIFHVTPEMKDRLLELADKRHNTLSRFVFEVILEYLEPQTKEIV